MSLLQELRFKGRETFDFFKEYAPVIILIGSLLLALGCAATWMQKVHSDVERVFIFLATDNRRTLITVEKTRQRTSCCKATSKIEPLLKQSLLIFAASFFLP